MTKQSKLCICLMLIFLCGCTHNDQSEIPISEPTMCSDHIETSFTTPVSEKSPETTVLDLSLSVDNGAYLSTYSDENTGDYLDYYLFIPEKAEIGMPLVVFLHGDGQIGQPDSLVNYGMINKAREIFGEHYPFIAISPCTRSASWTDGTIPDTLKGLIDQTIETYSTDPNRTIITGHSRGAMGVWYMISTYGSFFSAAVPVSCGASVQLDFDTCATVPVMAFVGDTGEYEYRYRLSMERIIYCINESDGKAELRILDNATHGETAQMAYTAEVFAWMLEQ